MALVHCDFYSDVLGLSVQMDAILPQETESQIGMVGVAARAEHPTLYLLHGLSDDHTIWQRRTSIERYVAPLGLAVMMPAVHRSFYTDMARGYRYWTFVSEELPRLARSFFHLSASRDDNFVAGLSMGGYGAFKLALRCPEKFAAAASAGLAGVTVAITLQSMYAAIAAKRGGSITSYCGAEEQGGARYALHEDVYGLRGGGLLGLGSRRARR